MFLIDNAQQGKGGARRARQMLRPYLEQHHDAQHCRPTVNTVNPAARKAYLAGGFVDTGEVYLGGGFGPQHNMRLPLCP